LFKLELNVAFWTLISFGIVYYIISRKIYPPISRLMQERAARISGDLAAAEARRKEAEDMRSQIEERLQNVRLEERRILSEAQEKARVAAEKKSAEYQAEFNRLRRAREEDLQKLEVDFYKNFEEKIGRLLIDACEKVLSCDLTEELRQKILQERIQELQKVKEF
jgi:F-type H+-transporting ATPase subunit b